MWLTVANRRIGCGSGASRNSGDEGVYWGYMHLTGRGELWSYREFPNLLLVLAWGNQSLQVEPVFQSWLCLFVCVGLLVWPSHLKWHGFDGDP